MKDFNKYFTLNLLSISGYLFLAFVLTAAFCLFPKMQEYAFVSDRDFNAYAEFFMLCGSVVLISTLVEFVLILIALPFEILIYKFRKTKPQIIKLPEILCKIHSIALIFGILLSMIPIVICVYILIHSV